MMAFSTFALVSANVSSVFRSVSQLLESYSPCSLVLLISFPLSQFPLFFEPLSLWSRIFFFSNFPDYRVGLFWVVSIIISCLELSIVFFSLVWYIFLLLPLFRGSLVVIVCPFFPTFLIEILPFLSFVQLPLRLPYHAYFL